MQALEKEPETAAKHCESKAVVYAGIQVTKNEEDILTLPPDHAIFPRVDIEEFDTEMEKCTIKCQWEVNKEERMFEQKKAREEAYEEVEKTEECVEGDDKVKNSLYLRNLRATAFKNNNRVILPQPGDNNEEIRRNNLKSELRKIVVKYRHEKCDTFRNLMDNNLSETQQKNLKNLKFRIRQD